MTFVSHFSLFFIKYFHEQSQDEIGDMMKGNWNRHKIESLVTCLCVWVSAKATCCRLDNNLSVTKQLLTTLALVDVFARPCHIATLFDTARLLRSLNSENRSRIPFLQDVTPPNTWNPPPKKKELR